MAAWSVSTFSHIQKPRDVRWREATGSVPPSAGLEPVEVSFDHGGCDQAEAGASSTGEPEAGPK